MLREIPDGMVVARRIMPYDFREGGKMSRLNLKTDQSWLRLYNYGHGIGISLLINLHAGL